MQTTPFTHQPQPPKRVPVKYPDQRYFFETETDSDSDDHSGISRVYLVHFGTEETADLVFSTYSDNNSHTTRQGLTADQCETLARALIDAAQDIRTHNPATTPTDDTEPVETTAWPFPPSTGPVPWTPAQIAAQATQQRASVGEALL